MAEDIFTLDHKDAVGNVNYQVSQEKKKHNCQSVRLQLLRAEIHTDLCVAGLRCPASTLILFMSLPHFIL